MTTRADFSDREWTRLSRAPVVAAMAITLADPGGPFEAVKESGAALKIVTTASQEGTYGEFVRALARDFTAKAERRENPMGGFRPEGADPRAEILDELRAVNFLLETKVADEDAAGYREWLKAAAQGAALAAKEGGFLGIGGVRVSAAEQHMLDTLGAIFGAPPPEDET